MATIDIKQLSAHIAKTSNLMRKSRDEALLRTAINATMQAKINSTKQFTGRWGYTLSGRLLNSIQYRFDKGTEGKIEAYVGAYGIPYGAIHEFGGKIVPKDAKYLWMRLPATNMKGSPWRRLSPSEFYKKAKKVSSGFYYFTSKKGNVFAAYKDPDLDDDEGKPELLFWLRDSVKIPERPYLRPAVATEMRKYPSLFQSIFQSYVAKRATT